MLTCAADDYSIQPFIEKFKVHTNLNSNVVLLRLFPSIRTETVAHFLEPPIEGVVLQCYGAGNMPSNRADIMKLLQKGVERGVLIVTVTQCTHGSVSGLYETGGYLLIVRFDRLRTLELSNSS